MTNEPGFTPGPWVGIYHPQHRMRVIADEGRATICDIALWRVDYEEQIANARLIVAAPDMYRALKGIVEAPSVYSDDHTDARAALAKAEGWEP